MIVTPGTHLNTSPQSGALYEDPNRPTPALTAVTVIGNAASFHGTYSTTACTSTVFLTSAVYLDLCSKLQSGTVRVDLIYDSAASGTTKPVMSSPTFTVI